MQRRAAETLAHNTQWHHENEKDGIANLFLAVNEQRHRDPDQGVHVLPRNQRKATTRDESGEGNTLCTNEPHRHRPI